MRALSLLSLKDNRLATKEGGKALVQALTINSTLKELDVSSNNWQEYGTFGNWMWAMVQDLPRSLLSASRIMGKSHHGWDQGHFQCYKGACDHFGTIFISI
jgi:hypothetical protein